jgi:hypothetical protein
MAKDKDVEIYQGSPSDAVTQANAGIKIRGKSFDAQPIEFTRVNKNTLAITINYRARPVERLLQITATKNPKEWKYLLSGKHPVISFESGLWFFGVL